MKENAPSATANIVAKNVLLIASTPAFARLVPEEAAHLSGLFVAGFSAKGRSFVRRLRSRWFRMAQRARERLTIPGLALHQALRKRHIERAVRASLADGFNQLVVLGGGLDTLAVRLHTEFPELNFIELDHPATQQVKLETLARHHSIKQNLKLLPVDLAKQDLEVTLCACPRYQAERKTIFLAEGVLMYLNANEVAAIFDCVQRQSCARRRFVFTYMELDERKRAGFRRSTWLVRLWLKLHGEPFKWGLQGNELESFLRERGFILRETATHSTFKEIYLSELGLEGAVLAEGENVCVADAL